MGQTYTEIYNTNPASLPLDGTEKLVVIQGGQSAGVTTQDIADLASSGGVTKDITIDTVGILSFTNGVLTALTIAAPEALTPVVISSSEIDLTWTQVSNATNYILQRATQSDYSDAVQIYSGSSLSYNNTSLTADTTYYYRVKAQASGYTDSAWTTASASTLPAVTTNYISFTNRASTITESPTNIYTGTAGKGISDYYLPANTTGYFQAKVQDANSIQAPIWFSEIDGIGIGTDDYTNGKVCIYPNNFNGMYFTIDNGGAATSSGVAYATGDLYRIRRSNAITGAFVAEKSSDNGTSWTTVKNYTYTSTAQLYLKMQFPVSGRNLAYPQHNNCVRRPIMIVNWGESNAGDGYANNGFLTPTELGVRNMKVWNNSSLAIESLHIGVNNMIDHTGLPDNATHGVSNGFANAYDNNTFSGTLVCMVMSGQGGSTIGEWDNTDPYYTTMTTRISGAQTALQSLAGVYPSIIFVCSQGINNMLAGTPAATWKAAIQTFFSNTRTSISYQVDFLITNFAGMTPNNQAYESTIASLAVDDPRVKVINTATATDMRDANHWQSSSQDIIAALEVSQVVSILKIQ